MHNYKIILLIIFGTFIVNTQASDVCKNVNRGGVFEWEEIEEYVMGIPITQHEKNEIVRQLNDTMDAYPFKDILNATDYQEQDVYPVRANLDEIVDGIDAKNHQNFCHFAN